MVTLLIAGLGYWLVWFSYNMSVTRGKHRVVKVKEIKEKAIGAHRRDGYNWRVMTTEWKWGKGQGRPGASLGWGWAS